MKLLLIGGGGREHALAWKLAGDTARPRLFCAPGNAGTAALGTNLDIKAEDVEGLLTWAKSERPDLTVVGPEAPLCDGLVDRFEEADLRVFGPNRAAARLEGSKIFTKDILFAAGVPAGSSQWFNDVGKALAYVEASPLPMVVKADGLAAGKGVTVCRDRDSARLAVREAMVDRRFGKSGGNLLVEECLKGREVSMMALVDGRNAVLLPSAQDHKRALDGDCGPNTGGMGAYSPSPVETPEFRAKISKEIINPTLKELSKRGIIYRGVLYAGLMLTESGPKVLEFNCRFGDPETQVIMPRLDGDLIPALEACIDGNLKPEHVRCKSGVCVCVVMTAGGYPDAYEKGDRITGLEEAGEGEGIMIFHAGTRLDGKSVVTAGGRVLGVTALGPDTAGAAAKAYASAAKVKFRNAHFRRDIAASVGGVQR